MMSREEFMALCNVVEYLLDNEKTSFDEWIDGGGKPDDHVYCKAMKLDDYVRGLLSMGCEPK